MKTKLFTLLFFVNASIFAQLINDNFDSETPGNLPEGWVINYNGAGVEQQQVVNTTYVSPSNSFELVSASLLAQIYKPFSTTENKLSIEVNMKSESSLANQTGYFSFYNTSENDHLAIVEFNNNKIITYYHNGNASDKYVIQDYEVDTCYNIKIEADLINRVYQVYINGTLASGTYNASTTNEFSMSPTNEPNSIVIASGNGGSNKMWFDDVKLYETPDLVAHYPFNGNANDESGNANHGTVNGATLTTDRHGVADKAYYFDGEDDFIECITQVGPFGTDSRTISFWAKTDVVPNASIQQNAVLSYGGNINTGGSRFEILLNPKCRGLAVDVSSKYFTKDFDNSDDDWHFYTVVYDNSISNALSDLKLYADGQLLTSVCNSNGDIDINTLNEQVLNIGRLFYTGQPRYYRGSIDEIKIYNYALSDEEVSAEASSLIAYYPFNGDANDYSGNDHHGTVYGATLTDDKDGTTDSAYYFDGIDNYIDIGDWENGGPMSFTFWARWDAFNTWSRIIDIGNGTRNDDIMVANESNTSDLSFYVHRSDLDDFKIMSIPEITQSQWDFFTATVNSDGVMKLYKNATFLSEITDGYTPNYVLRIEQYLGKSLYSGDQYFNGAIDELRIFDKSLIQQEITDIYEAGVLEVTNYDTTNELIYASENILYIKNGNTNYKQIALYNLVGQQVYQNNEVTFPLDINFLKTGVYVVKLMDVTGTNTSKKIIIK